MLFPIEHDGAVTLVIQFTDHDMAFSWCLRRPALASARPQLLELRLQRPKLLMNIPLGYHPPDEDADALAHCRHTCDLRLCCLQLSVYPIHYIHRSP